MFSKKPVESAIPKNPSQIKGAALEFLEKNYNEFKDQKPIPNVLYVLDPNSINYMKKITLGPIEDRGEEGKFSKISCSYIDKNGQKKDTSLKPGGTWQNPLNVITAESEGVPVQVMDRTGNITLRNALNPKLKFGETIWYTRSPFVQTADKVRFGGKRKTKRKRKTRSNR
jgi:hypothetical protein